MPGDFIEEPKKILPIIYMIDTSGSMDGKRINSVNEAMRDSIPIMEKIANDNTNAQVAVAVMSFDSNVRWIQEGLCDVGDFEWEDLEANGMTYLGDALIELDKRLSRHGEGFLTEPIGYKLPVIILMSDGYPNGNWEDGLKRIQGNKWFEHSTRIAIGIGDDFDYTALAAFTGDAEAVIPVSKQATLIKMIRVLSATASKVGSQSHVGGENTGKDIINTVRIETGMSNPDNGIILADPFEGEYVPNHHAAINQPAEPDEFDDGF